jgi:hypothetical protein
MQTQDKTRTRPRSKSPTAECCTESPCDSGLRNNYFEGKRLTPDMFRIEQRYLNDRRRLLNRAIHGWGVVYGYGIAVAAAKNDRRTDAPRGFDIQTGLALDPCGRELLQVGAAHVGIPDLIPIDADGRRADLEDLLSEGSYKDVKEPPRTCWLISAHYAEEARDRVRINDPCHCEHDEWDHACETVRYSLRRIDCGDCRCTKCDCDLWCDCDSDVCCEEETPPRTVQQTALDATTPEPEAVTRRCLPFRRGGCRCLCHYLTALDPGDECARQLCTVVEPCALVRVDLANGVPLACIELVGNDCGDLTIADDIHTCSPRRLVKGNDLLFDLIRGCDLTRLDKIGWSDWHRAEGPVAFEEFYKAFFTSGSSGEGGYVSGRLWVEFSRPVCADTLRPDVFAITVLSVERDNWLQPLRVPIIRVESVIEGGDRCARRATVVVDSKWVDEALRCRGGVFSGDTWVEIAVRGDFILDCNGQPVDAVAVGLAAVPTGNGSPGGTFLSTFRVAKREPHSYPVGRDPENEGASS